MNWLSKVRILYIYCTSSYQGLPFVPSLPAAHCMLYISNKAKKNDALYHKLVCEFTELFYQQRISIAADTLLLDAVHDTASLHGADTISECRERERERESCAREH